MYSAETLISMVDGTFKNINNIRVGDKIYNKLFKPVSVSRIHLQENTPVAEIQLNNGTGVFFISPTTKVFSHCSRIDGSQCAEYCTIADTHAEGGKLKNSIKILSPESDVVFTTFNNSNVSLTKTTYCIHTLDPTRTFFANKIIACCCNEII